MGTISRAQVQEADIFLYKGDTLIGRLILALDGTGFSHAGLFLGHQRGSVGESVFRGVVEQRVATSISDSSLVVDYRCKKTVATQPIIARADHYLAMGIHYGFKTLVLCGAIALTKKVARTRIFPRFITKLFDATTALLMRIPDPDPNGMICSEFVYRCYTGIPANVRGCLEPPAAKGAVPEPGSLLDLLSNETLAAMVKVPGRRRIAQDIRPLERDLIDDGVDNELGELIGLYCAEVEQGQTDVLIPASALTAVWGAAEGFAAELLRLQGLGQQAMARGQSLSLLAQRQPHFVTPGDLSQDPRLHRLGELIHSEW